MHIDKACSLIVGALLFAAGAAYAQEGDGYYSVEDEGRFPRFEVTPYIGYRGGGQFDVQNSDDDAKLDSHRSLALSLAYRIDPGAQYELFYGRQDTSLEADSPFGAVDVDVEYLHIGGTLVTNDERRVKPYIMGGLGVTRFKPDLPGTNNDTRFSLSLGGGLRVPFNDNFSLRLEARGFVSFLDTDSAVFCVSGQLGGLCDIRGGGKAFFQYDVLAGAAFAF